jgi:hypothetical protein
MRVDRSRLPGCGDLSLREKRAVQVDGGGLGLYCGVLNLKSRAPSHIIRAK